MSDTRFNGWTNYATWAVAVWVASDEDRQFYWCEQATLHRAYSSRDQMILEGRWTPEETAIYSLADQLKEETSGNAREIVDCAYFDLLNAAFSEVNWEEIAECFLEHTEGWVLPLDLS
jgi:hypothetical protein